MLVDGGLFYSTGRGLCSMHFLGCILTLQNSLSDSKVRVFSHLLINEVLDIAGFCGLPVILLKSVFLWQSYVALKLLILIKIGQIEKERQM